MLKALWLVILAILEKKSKFSFQDSFKLIWTIDADSSGLEPFK